MATPNEGENTELVIGLVGPIGTNLKAVKKVLSEELGKTGYSVEEIKISEDGDRPSGRRQKGLER